jgi:hypothetical protein
MLTGTGNWFEEGTMTAEATGSTNVDAGRKRFAAFMGFNLLGILFFLLSKAYVYYLVYQGSSKGRGWQSGVMLYLDIIVLNPLLLLGAQLINWYFRWRVKKDSPSERISDRRRAWLWAMSLLWLVATAAEFLIAA